jgi:CHAD domain-containing protein
MAVSPTRYDLLRARLERFSHALPGVETRDIKAVHRTRVASRRLRELLPVLQLDRENAAKLSHQLRKVTRRLGPVREADVMLLLIAELHESGRFHTPTLRLVQDAVRARRHKMLEKLPDKASTTSLRRLERKLGRAAEYLKGAEDADTRRAWRWALDARVSRRAVALMKAIDDAGSVYLPDRVHAVRISLKKLRYGLELDTEARGQKPTADLRTLRRMQELLGRVHDRQVIVDQVREIQASLKPPSITAWRELDSVVRSLERSCRRLHARYVGERPTLIEICERLVRRHPAAGRPKKRQAG